MKDTKLTKTSPESVGIPSETIRNYIEALIERGVNLHSFLVLKNNKICAEGYCPPYTEDKLQRMYSISKTFTSIAIGLLADEGKISLKDKIVNYFPDYLPENPHKWLLDMTIEDLLKMSTCFTETLHRSGGGPWVKSYLNCPVTHPAGTVFIYDTAGTHTLCAVVERVTGMKMLDYMRTRFLDKIGFSKDAWCIKGTDGYSWGGSGILATLRDLAKFASTVMHGGRFDGKQLLSEEYVKKATSKQIFNDEYANGCLWNEGYGYQIWILKDGAFAFRGMGSQHAICFPDKDLIFCCTADNQGAELWDRLIYEELYRRLLPYVGNEKLAENEAELTKLEQMCSEMKLPVVKGEKDSPLRESVNGVTYILDDGPVQISKLCFSFDGDEGKLTYFTPRGEKQILFGFGKHMEYEFPEDHYFYEQIDVPSGKGYRAWSSAAWADEHTLVLRTETLDEYLGNFTATFSFKGDEIGVIIVKTAEFFFDEYPGVCGGRKEKRER